MANSRHGQDVVIVGAGPAGASCALWLGLMGARVLLVDARPRPGGLLLGCPFPNPWIAVVPGVPSGDDLARGMARALAEGGIPQRLGVPVAAMARDGDGFALWLDDGGSLAARFVVLATGVRPASGGLAPAEGVLFGPGGHISAHDFSGLRVAVLGGGDNAFENALFVRERGARKVRVFARSIRARRAFLERTDPADVTLGEAAVDTAVRTVNGRAYDRILVMYGFTPVLPALDGMSLKRDGRGFVATSCVCETGEPGLFAIGEMTGRMHPSVPTALADGVVAAKAIQTRLERGAAEAFRMRVKAQTKP